MPSLNWNAESHNPQVHIFYTLTERMFVKGPKKRKSCFWTKNMTLVILGAMICLLAENLAQGGLQENSHQTRKVLRFKTHKCLQHLQHTASPKRTPNLRHLWHNMGTILGPYGEYIRTGVKWCPKKPINCRCSFRPIQFTNIKYQRCQ